MNIICICLYNESIIWVSETAFLKDKIRELQLCSFSLTVL